MIEEIENLKMIMVDYRNNAKKDLSDDELKSVDEYIDKVIEDISPAFSLIEKLSESKEQLASFKENLDKHMKENKWLEKLLKTS